MKHSAYKTVPGGLIAYRKFKAKELVEQANEQKNPLNERWFDDVPIPEALPIIIECCKPKCCNTDSLDDMLNILCDNMKGFYKQSSWKWDTDLKREEAFSPKSWLLICRIRENESSQLPLIAGFASFRFEREMERPVLYCYEIQLRDRYRGRSIGRYLMNILSLIAKNSKMTSIMLTVFKFNERALRFFQNLGFVKDESDPSNFEGNPKMDYLIMSKRIT
ncbi:N-alpha-acetyltransferase 40 NatD catalytic subunit [Fasciola gigantica]|uniref:N-alpha-acetyltransferase 40 n=1 Tax=Fasciola gigantica TaxID=46835 RepID=A0A504Z959_FASGI|nr:N-alpha-acetyltransferase 40 NatD catalytic subunit [Fasciola gigantica]